MFDFKKITIKQLKYLALELAPFMAPNQFWLFNGELGAGKTTFIQFLVHYFLPTQIVPSPTFNVLNQYEIPAGTINHYDFYRFKNVNAVEKITFQESFENNINLIEWVTNFGINFLKDKKCIEINLMINKDDSTTRDLSINTSIILVINKLELIKSVIYNI